MRLTVTSYVTLDGVMQAPGGADEDRSDGFDRGGWAVPFVDDDVLAHVFAIFGQAEEFLLGRRTYDDWATHWPPRGDETPVSAALNALPKHVLSQTLTAAAWPVTEVHRDLDTVRRLLERPGGELQVHGSGMLARSLARAGLVDEYRLLVYPVLVGTGRRLFDTDSLPAMFRTAEARTSPSGVQLVHLVRA